MPAVEHGASVDVTPSIPELPRRHLARPHLVDRIAGDQADVTALVAGAGYGKSVLLREWVDSFTGIAAVAAVTGVGRPVRDGAVILRNLLRSLSEQTGGVGSRTLREIEGGRTPLLGLRDLVCDEVGRLSPTARVALVIDDFHELGSPDLGLVLDGVVRAHPGVHLILAGRGDPSSWLTDWRLQGRLLELRQKDLAFTVEETRALLHLVADVQLDAPSSALLVSRTEGWPAGVQMSALAMLGEEAPDEVVRSFAGSDRVIADYFLDRVLDRAQPGLRDFLLRVSVFDEITIGAATEVTGRADAGTVLRDLEARNLFTTRTASGSFRLHPLFAELLRYELQTVDRSVFTDAHRRASVHLERTGDRLGALHHLAEAGEFGLLADYLADHLVEIWRSEGETAIIPWVDQVLAHVLRADPARVPALAVGVAATGSVHIALDLASKLASHPDVRSDPELRAQIEWFRAICVAALGDLDGATDALTRIRAEDPGSVPAHPMSVIWRELPLAFMFADDWETFDREWQWGVERGLDHTTLPVVLTGVRGIVLARRGFVHDAEELVDAGLGWLAEHRVSKMSAMSHLHSAAALVSLEHGALADAEQHALEALELCELFEPVVMFRAHAEASRAEVARRSGRPAEALSLLQEASWRARPDDVLRPHLRAILAETELRCACDVGDHVTATHAVERLISPAARAAGWARIHLQAGNSHAAEAALPSTEELVELANDQPRRAVELLALRARAVGGHSSVDRALHHAVVIASEHGLLGTLSSEGLEHQELIRAADRDAARQLAALAATRVDPARALVDALSVRELELLRLLPTEMPNRQLASELYIGLNTLKTHLKSIYRKLGVESRADAVRRGRELRLLPPRDPPPTLSSRRTTRFG